MATETKYTYSIAADTLNSKLAGAALHNEIASSSIPIALDRITATGDVLDVVMKDILSVPEKTVLDNTLAAHTGVPLSSDPQPVELTGPHTADNKIIVLINKFPGTVTLYHTSAGDDIAGNKRGEGPQFELSRSTAGDSEQDEKNNRKS